MRISDWSSDVCSSDLIDARIDHRTLAAKGIELEPQHKIGPAASRMPEQGLEAERVEDNDRIERAHGEKIIAEPGIDLDRKGVVAGKHVSVRVDLGGRRIHNQKKIEYIHTNTTKCNNNTKND